MKGTIQLGIKRIKIKMVPYNIRKYIKYGLSLPITLLFIIISSFVKIRLNCTMKLNIEDFLIQGGYVIHFLCVVDR